MDLGSNVERAMAFKWVTPSITFYHPPAVSSSCPRCGTLQPGSFIVHWMILCGVC